MLRKLPVFKNRDISLIAALAGELYFELYPAREFIYYKGLSYYLLYSLKLGEIGSKMYFLSRGRVEHFMFDTPLPPFASPCKSQDDGYFGETALILGKRETTLRTSTSCLVLGIILDILIFNLVLSYESFEKVGTRFPDILLELRSEIAQSKEKTLLNMTGLINQRKRAHSNISTPKIVARSSHNFPH